MTAARTPRPGELSLVPDVPRQVRRITLEVEQLDGGVLRFTQPRVPGWVAAGRTHVDVVRILAQAFTERMVVAHSEWRGTIYDHPAAPQHRRHKPRSRGRKRCDVYSADEWMLDVDGKWVSPGGHRYREETDAVQKVIRARRAMGLPDRPGADASLTRLESITGTQQSFRLEAVPGEVEL